MIKAIHTLIYSDDPEATRAFLRDVLGWPFVQEPDTVPPWPIFKIGPSEMGVHPTSGGEGDQAYSQPRHQSISLMCNDIAETGPGTSCLEASSSETWPSEPSWLTFRVAWSR